MTAKHIETQEEQVYWQLLDETKSELSEAACTIVREAWTAAYAANMVRSYSFQPGEYEEAMEKMRLAATELTDRGCELLAKIWRAALAAAASIDADDFETLAGFRVYRGDLHHFYRMLSHMIEQTLQERRVAKLQKEVARQESNDLPDRPI
jgi:hypothetical protein